jgi:hypothetical protein
MDTDVRLQHYARLVGLQRDENQKLREALRELLENRIALGRGEGEGWMAIDTDPAVIKAREALAVTSIK